jgi:hypothetical protein
VRQAALDRFNRRIAKAQSEAVDRGEFILRYSKARQKFEEELEELAPAKENSRQGKKASRLSAVSRAPSANRSPNPQPAVIGDLERSYDPTARPRSTIPSFSSISKAADDNTIYDTICALATARQRPNETPESALARFVSAAPGMLNAMRGTVPPSPLASSLSKRLLLSESPPPPDAGHFDPDFERMMSVAKRLHESEPSLTVEQHFARLYESPQNIAKRKS